MPDDPSSEITVNTPEKKANDTLNAGQILAERFELTQPIGRGGIGQVWLAQDRYLEGEAIACKVLKHELMHDRRALADLKREVLLARRLRHPNILAVYTFWESTPWYFITMEYVAGRNLGEALLERGHAYTLPEILPWINSLSSALDYAHRQGVLHRDVKPGNMLLDTENTIRLADFGIARTAREVHVNLSGEMTCGTLLYVSPEQLRGEALDGRSDLYSLTASTYEMLAGRPPFPPESLIAHIQMMPPEPIPHLSKEINAILLKGLAKTPENRFQNCAAFYQAMASAAPHHSTSPPPCTTAIGTDTVVLTRPEEDLQHKRLGDLLVEAEVITAEQLESALEKQCVSHEKLGNILIRMEVLDEIAIARTLSTQLRLPYCTLEDMVCTPEVLPLLSAPAAAARRCIPLRKNNEQIVVAMADPLDLPTVNTLETVFGSPITICVATPSNVLTAIETSYGCSG